MKQIQLSDLNILRIGNEIDLSGMIYNDHVNDISYIISFPESSLQNELINLNLDHDSFKKFIQQTDLLETEIIDGNTNRKILIRKSQRQLDANVSWKVFARDNYHCRYCNITGVPLTVDHLILWEHQGPSIEENLVTSCKKCNKTRGNMEYQDWIKSYYYKKVSSHLSPDIITLNKQLIEDIKSIDITKNKRNR